MPAQPVRGFSSDPMTLPGESSGLLDCSGSGFVNLGTRLPVKVDGSASFTIECWLRFHSMADGQIISQLGEDGNGALNFGTVNGDRLYAHVGAAQKNIQGAPGLQAERWYFVCLTYDGNTLSIYRNGALETQGSNWGRLPTGNNPVLLAALTRQGMAGVNADLWNVQVYTTARSSEQVYQDMWAYADPDGQPWAACYDFSVVPARERVHGLPFTLANGARSVYSIPAVRLIDQAYCDASDEHDIAPGGSDPYTIQAWVMLEETAGTQTVYVTGDTTDASTIAVTLEDGAVTARRRGTTVTGKTRLQAGQWHSVAATFDGTTLSVYLDGRPDGAGRADAIPEPSATDVLIGAHRHNGAAQGFLQGYVQFLSYWSRALSADEVRRYMYADPLYQDGLVADFAFTLAPANDLMEGHRVTLEGGAELTELRVPVTGAGTETAPEERAGESAGTFDWSTVDRDALRRALEGFAPVVSPRGFGPEHERLLRGEFQRALPQTMPRAVRAAYTEHFERQLDLARRVAAGEDVETPFGNVVYQLVDGEHVITHHTAQGTTVVLRAPEEAIDPCVIWWLTFTYTLLAGVLSIFGFPTPTSKAKEFVQKLVSNPEFLATVKTVIGGTFSALSILNFLKVLYDFGFLKTFVWFCVKQASWWALGRFVVYLVGLIAPTASPQKALFIANSIVLVTQLLAQIATYADKCPSARAALQAQAR